MTKLNLNKETISQMDKNEMEATNGGFEVCLKSCANGSRKGKSCCDGDPVVLTVEISIE